jgi:uncharacterized membrane protein
MLLILGLAFAAIVFVARWMVPLFMGAGRSGHGLGTLQARFARGEISEEDYERRRSLLRGA